MILDLLQNSFNKDRFIEFIRLITKNFKHLDEHLEGVESENYTVFPVSSFKDNNDLNFQVILVETDKPSKIEKARIEQREIIRKYINQNLYSMPSGILAVFYSPDYPLWRLSYVEIDWERRGKLKTPPRRFSYLVGQGEPVHTPAKQLLKLLEDPPSTIQQIKEAFSVEKLTDEFFQKYRNLYLKLKEHVEKEPANKPLIENLKNNGYSVDDFAKKLLGQLVFLYFLQKKGWLGVPEDKLYGEGDKKFLRNLFEKARKENKNYYLDYLIPLFYETLNNPRENQAVSDWSGYFHCKIPFLNGGLFEPIYDYKKINVYIDNEIFSKDTENEEDKGILDIFDIYNFTVKEDEPLEKEVAVDPEMLGKVFENLISENERKGQGAFYTPREIVHYMSQQSIVYYLSDKFNLPIEEIRTLFTKEHFEELPESIKERKKEIDNELKNLKIVDPACGSGAFLVGVLHEVIKARSLLNQKQDFYKFKKEAIENSIYGVDIDIGATEIAKLRLWLSLIVDEESIYKIEPLPNLEYKIMCGNSLLEELVIGDEVIHLSVESEYKKDLKSQIEVLEKELEEKRRLLFELIREKGKNNKEVKELEKEIRKIENKVKNFKGKPQQKVNSTLLGIVDLNEAFEEIKKLQHQFFNEHNPEKKKVLKAKIDAKLKEFVLRKIEEEEKKLWQKINQINNKYIGRNMPKSEEKKINKYTAVLNELEEYKKKLNFRGCNKNFFLWHLNFSEVFIEKRGFDIVIANPPYVDSETMKLNNPVLREIIPKFYRTARGNWDLYIPFIELSLYLMNKHGVASYIIPNKWLVLNYGKEIRKEIRKNLIEIIDCSQEKIFEAGNNPVILFLENFSKKEIINVKEYIECKFLSRSIINRNSLREQAWGILLSEDKEIIIKIINNAKLKLQDFYIVENPFTTSEAYELKKILEDKNTHSNNYFKFVNTGTIDPFISLWGKKETKYLKNTYKYPVIKKSLFKKFFPRRYVQQFKEKIIISGIRHFESFIDINKEYVAGKSTLILFEKENNIFKLKLILSILNSSLIKFFIYEVYKYAGIDGGINFNKDMINELPIPKIPEDQQKPFIELVDKILQLTNREDYEHRPELQQKVQQYSNQIDQLVYKLYNLTDEEIERIERKLEN